VSGSPDAHRSGPGAPLWSKAHDQPDDEKWSKAHDQPDDENGGALARGERHGPTGAASGPWKE